MIAKRTVPICRRADGMVVETELEVEIDEQSGGYWLTPQQISLLKMLRIQAEFTVYCSGTYGMSLGTVA